MPDNLLQVRLKSMTDAEIMGELEQILERPDPGMMVAINKELIERQRIENLLNKKKRRTKL